MPETLQELLAIEHIKQLKYRYLRGIDTADIELLDTVFAREASCAFYGGSYTHIYDSREAVLGFLRDSFHSECISKHSCHHPEIAIQDADHATGRWGLNDYFEDFRSQTIVRGAAFYEDTYVREDGVWKIRHTGYRRLYEQVLTRDDSVQLTAHYLGQR